MTLRFPQSYENCMNAIGGINQKKKVVKNNGKLSKKEGGYAAYLYKGSKNAVLVPLRVFSLKRSTAEAFQYLLGYCAEKKTRNLTN